MQTEYHQQIFSLPGLPGNLHAPHGPDAASRRMKYACWQGAFSNFSLITGHGVKMAAPVD
jgi:hypothetical protein